MAQTAIGSTTLSLSYVARFTGTMEGTLAPQTLEGLWWARDAGVGGFISVSNASGGARNVSVQAVTASGESQPAQALSLAPHASQMLDLGTLVGRPLNAGEAGGLRVQFTGLEGEVNVTGGLENRKEGYSAVMSFWMPSVASTASPVTLAHAGLMVGAADAMMGFPAATRFSPYFALRNLTAQAVPVSLTLYTEQGQSLQGPVQSLQPLESRQVDMVRVLQGLGLANFSGMLTLAVSHTGQASDVMVAAGSVDAKGTYVFEVEGRTAEETLSKEAPYWSVRDGNNTMAALWNPSGNAEDVIVTLNYSGNAGKSGHYNFRVHIAPHATASLDVKELIAIQSPDSEGNVMPAGAQEGNFVFRGAAGVHSKLSLNANVGIFNVVKGTCYYGTIWCAGYTGLAISPASISLAVGGTQQINALGMYDDGSQPGVNSSTSWSCSSPSIASITQGGQVTAVASGSATINASASLPAYGQYSGYNPSCVALQVNRTFAAQAQAGIYKLLCTPNPITRAGTITCTVSGVSASQVSNWQFTSSNGSASGAGGQTTWSGVMVQSGTVQVNLTSGGSAQVSVTVNPRNFAVSAPVATLVANGAPGLPTLVTPPTNRGEDGVFGASLYTFGFSESAPAPIPSGPNTGFVYVGAFSDTSTYVYELNPGITNLNDPFYQHQYGRCGIPSAAAIVAAVTTHEAGLTNSHWSEVASALGGSNPGTLAEGSIGTPGTNPQTWITSLNQTITATYQSAFNAGKTEPTTNLPNNINYAPYSTCP